MEQYLRRHLGDKSSLNVPFRSPDGRKARDGGVGVETREKPLPPPHTAGTRADEPLTSNTLGTSSSARSYSAGVNSGSSGQTSRSNIPSKWTSSDRTPNTTSYGAMGCGTDISSATATNSSFIGF